MTRVIVIGCGVIGAMTAYELSQVQGLEITVLDRQPPAQGSTGAALGVLMGVVSQKVKGRQWRLRWESLQRYEQLVPELEAATGQHIPFNRKGILKLLLEGDSSEGSAEKWRSLLTHRQAQNLPLELLSAAQVQAQFPEIQAPGLVGAVYSGRDRQLDPTALTLALVAAARQRGVQFRFDADVDGFLTTLAQTAAAHPRPESPAESPAESLTNSVEPEEALHCTQVCWAEDSQPADYVVIAAGLGSSQLTGRLQQPLEILPVLGQALQVWTPSPILGHDHLHPVITGDDVHIVPLLKPWIDEAELHPQAAAYWIGATVELPDHQGNPAAIAKANLEAVWQKAIAFCPDLAKGEIVRTWSGYRPRPHNRPAPVFEKLPGYNNVLLATAHYRNGVLLAPATAQWVVGEVTG